MRISTSLLLCLLLPQGLALAAAKPLSSAEILEKSDPADWRAADPENTLYLQLAGGRVVIELAPAFAPQHAANIRALAREHYYDGLAIVRVQDNYVVQWGDPAEEEKDRKPIKEAKPTLPAEFERVWSKDLPFTRLPDGDVYAARAGHSGGLPVAGDPKFGKIWLAHCYGMVGAGRDMAPDSGGGTELYVVSGHAPRHLDRNVTLVGRVLQGMDLLTSLPRGTGALGFYEKPEQRVPLQSIRVATDVLPAERTPLEVLRTDTPTWKAFVDARRSRREDWFVQPTGRIELCNVPIPVRAARP